MIEATQLKPVDVMEPQCHERVVAGVRCATLGSLQHLNPHCKHGTYPTVALGANVASPEIHRVHFSIVERRPSAE